MSPHQHLQSIHIHPQDTTQEPNSYKQEINININFSQDPHTIHITQHTNSTTSSQITLHIQHLHKTKTTDTTKITTTPQTHQHHNIWVKPTDSLILSTIHCAHICILHPQPSQIPWTHTITTQQRQLRTQIVAAILLHYVNPQLQ